MAENRGGARVPGKPASYSGPGKGSRRTDGQPVRSPNVQEGTDLTQGERRVIEQGQRSRPLSSTPTPNIQAAPRGGSPAAAGGAVGQPPPGHLVGIPSTRPNEDPMVAPPPVIEPQDEVDIVLAGLAEITGDHAISQMLNEHREFKAWKTSGQSPQQVSGDIAPAGEPAPEDLATPTDEPSEVFDLAIGGTADEDVEPTSVETSATPSEGGEDDLGTGLPAQATERDATVV